MLYRRLKIQQTRAIQKLVKRAIARIYVVVKLNVAVIFSPF